MRDNALCMDRYIPPSPSSPYLLEEMVNLRIAYM